MNNTIKFYVDSKNSGKRLDVFLAENTKNFTRSYLKKLIGKKLVRLNDSSCLTPSTKVKYKDVNVLADDNLREGIKTFSNWPTIPQLYVKGEFVGGCDIITEMAMSGELDDLFTEKKIKFNSESATKIREANKD